MDIKQLKLDNLGRFKSLEIDFSCTSSHGSNVTVFIGHNGAGKTSILKALATGLSWFVARVRTDKAIGSPIDPDYILNGQNSAAITVTVSDQQRDFEWRLAKSRPGRKGEHSSQLNGASDLADVYRTNLTSNKDTSLPLIAFYSVERVVLDIPLRTKVKHTFEQLDGYDNSLNKGVDFRRFFEWFREREDSENESTTDQLENLLKDIDQEKSSLNFEDFWYEIQKAKDHQLNAVREAIERFTGFKNIKIKRKPKLHMAIDKNGQTLNVSQLSQGEKSLMALVGDIARRLAMMNPALTNPLEGDGVVLIDEVDMHLHPKWAREMIANLTKTFPNCQFILTTHSPLVISDAKDILVYALDDGNLKELSSQYGQDANTVLLEVMNTNIRNDKVTEQLNELLNLIQDRNLDEAQKKLEALQKELHEDNSELLNAKWLLKKEIRHAKNPEEK